MVIIKLVNTNMKYLIRTNTAIQPTNILPFRKLLYNLLDYVMGRNSLNRGLRTLISL